MKYTRPVALTATALMLAALTACGGAGKMPEDHRQALYWAVENFTNGHSDEVAEAIPPHDMSGSNYLEDIGNGLVGEKSKCTPDPDTVKANDEKVSVTVSCEDPLPGGQGLENGPEASLFIDQQGVLNDFQFEEEYIDPNPPQYIP